MSSYGGGNGYFYNSHYYEMCLNSQNINPINVTNSPVIIKCEPENNTASAAPIVKCEENNDIVKLNNNAVIKCEENHSIDSVAVLEKFDKDEQDESDSPEIDIMVNNVVASFNVRCHLNLRQIALKGVNVEYRRENGMVTMKLRRPYTTASIWSSGKITCTGATSDEDAKTASRKIARILQQLGFRVRFSNYRVVNVLCTCILYFGINLIKFAQKHRGIACYEPELHPGATYRNKELKATLKIFTTGSITVTAPSIRNAQLAIEHIFPLVAEFKTAKPPSAKNRAEPVLRRNVPSFKRKREIDSEDESPDLPDSDESYE